MRPCCAVSLPAPRSPSSRACAMSSLGTRAFLVSLARAGGVRGIPSGTLQVIWPNLRRERVNRGGIGARCV